jgi:hypothetical protein
VQKESDLKRDVEGLDPNAILSSKRKSAGSAGSTSESAANGAQAPPVKVAAAGNSSERPAKRTIQYNSSDEEADF